MSAPAAGRPHVAFVSSSAPTGPGDAYSAFILGLAAGVQARGVRVTLLTPHVRGSAEREELEGVAVRRFRYLPRAAAETLGLGGGMLPGLKRRPLDLLKVPFLLAGQRRALAALHRRDPVALVHSHWLVPQALVAGGVARSRGLPHVATAHGSDLLGLPPALAGPALRRATRLADVVTVNSRAMAEVLERRTGRRGRLVPFGALRPDPGAVEGNRGTRRSLAGPGGSPVVGFVGRVVEEKGIETFVRALGHLRDEGRPTRGVVVGAGSATAAARALCAELGIADRVTFTGAVPPERVPHYLACVDALVVPSRYEAQGLVAVEAMLSGVPVVASATGGLTELVVDGETGLTVPAGDAGAVARALTALLATPGLADDLARAAHRRVEASHTMEATADAFVGIYRELLDA